MAPQAQKLLRVLLKVTLTITISGLTLTYCLAAEPEHGSTYGPSSIKLHEQSLDSPISQLIWSKSSDFVWIRTYNNTVYKSVNSGESWSSQMAMMPHSNEAVNGNGMSSLSSSNSQSQSYGVIEIIECKSNPRILFFRGVGTYNWLTLDGGQSYAVLESNPSFIIESLSFHPTQTNWALASERERCDEHYTQCCHRVYATKDLGSGGPVLWKLISDGVQDFSWTGYGEKVIITAKPGNDTLCGRWDIEKNAYIYSDPFGKTADPVVAVKNGNSMRWTNSHHLLYVAARPEKTTSSLFVSADNANTFLPIKLPEALPESGYGILDTDNSQASQASGSVFLEVSHTKAMWGHLYMSGGKGQRFTLSKEHLHCPHPGKCDFVTVGTLPGVFIANSVVNWADADSGQLQLQSHITFDQGAQWHLLSAPTKKSTGEPLDCSRLAGCSLHLHAQSSNRPFTRIWSPSGTLGLVIALGNTGSSLQYQYPYDEIQTQLVTSRDGGVSWNFAPLPPGTYDYDIGDHGGIIIAVPNANKNTGTSVLYYSMDEGASFEELVIAQDPVLVDWVQTQEYAMSSHMLIVGRRTTDAGSENSVGVVIHVSFAEYYERMCCEELGDFETWTPSDSVSSKCLMGRDVTFKRRKPKAECYLGEKYIHQQSETPCACTASDFECDYGWVYDQHNGCVPENSDVLEKIEANKKAFYANCEPGTELTLPNGYRKVPLNGCQGGVDPSGAVIKCKKPMPSNGAQIFVLVIFGILVTGSVGLCVFMANRSKEFRRFVLNIYHGIPALVGIRSKSKGPLYRQVRMPDEDILGVGGLGLDMDLDDFSFSEETPVELDIDIGSDIRIPSLRGGGGGGSGADSADVVEQLMLIGDGDRPVRRVKARDV